jgi:hypothetical protein
MSITEKQKMVITNKEKFMANKEISFMLDQLQIAIEKGDYFSTSVLITRLKSLGYRVEKDCDNDENAVQ